MRMMVLVKATEESERGDPPTPGLLAAMWAVQHELRTARILRELGGLRSTSAGRRVRFDGARRTVVDGPIAAISEVVAGFWI